MPGENQDKLMSGNQPEVQYAAFLAIDWADQKHVWSLQEANSSARERGEVDHMPEAVETWVAQLSQRFAGRPIAVAVEQSRGALVFLLSKYAQLHIFPVPPAMTANLRKAFYSSGAKNDPTDADLLLDLVQQHREKLRRLSPDTEATRRNFSRGGAAQAGGRKDGPEQSFGSALENLLSADSPLVWGCEIGRASCRER